jgi:hypothetical protein
VKRGPTKGEPEEDDPRDLFATQNFLDEERAADRASIRRTLVKWILAFGGLFGMAAMVFWWSGAAIEYSANRVQKRSNPTYEVTGTVIDRRTHQPVPWVEVSTEFQFGGAFYSSSTDLAGHYVIETLAEPHYLVFKANGYATERAPVGKQWFSWMPRGSEVRNVQLTPAK